MSASDGPVLRIAVRTTGDGFGFQIVRADESWDNAINLSCEDPDGWDEVGHDILRLYLESFPEVPNEAGV